MCNKRKATRKITELTTNATRTCQRHGSSELLSGSTWALLLRLGHPLCLCGPIRSTREPQSITRPHVGQSICIVSRNGVRTRICVICFAIPPMRNWAIPSTISNGTQVMLRRNEAFGCMSSQGRDCAVVGWRCLRLNTGASQRTREVPKLSAFQSHGPFSIAHIPTYRVVLLYMLSAAWSLRNIPIEGPAERSVINICLGPLQPHAWVICGATGISYQDIGTPVTRSVGRSVGLSDADHLNACQ
ncbi:hypothetical protein M011DRAFT_230736 [Sporormia fimetaria CBS 119925]|uniref:Uncharacterized protein n=1 Tax=Sporormia fimetaria CBS 119925 TaxID=1340428 RepID=A0A6A6VLU8_9PLEO|nr:hypothetical protein M011DRAFT_230736 [Sporormia fimetaria CBS 119925]